MKAHTATIRGWVEEKLTAEAHEAEDIGLARKSIGDCVNCFRCQQDCDEPIAG
jgi:multimeric flavodoxin WrbA